MKTFLMSGACLLLLAGTPAAAEDAAQTARNAAGFHLVLAYQCGRVTGDAALYARALDAAPLTLEAAGYSADDANAWVAETKAAVESEKGDPQVSAALCTGLVSNIESNLDQTRAEIRHLAGGPAQ